MLFELRQYRVQPGKRDAWVKFFEDVIVPFQTAKGMTILGSWTAEEDEEGFVWVRRFEDEADRERLYAAVYESDEWKTTIGPGARDLLQAGKAVITRMNPTPQSKSR